MPRDAAAAQKSKKDILMVALLGYWSSVQVVGDTNLMDVILDDVLRRSEGGRGRGREVKIWRGRRRAVGGLFKTGILGGTLY